jgi:hypothetical protein
MFFKKEDMDAIYPIDLYRAKVVFDELIKEQKTDSLLISEKFYFYFPFVNTVEPTRYKIFLKDFYNSMKNLPVQNIYIDNLEVNEKIFYHAFEFEKEKYSKKIISEFNISTEQNIFSFFKGEFCKEKINLKFEEIFEEFNTEKEGTEFGVNYKENFSNDSGIWLFFNEMLKKKFSTVEKELIEKEMAYETFEEEREYILIK